MIKGITKIVVDGEEYSISEDRKDFKGAHRKYTFKEFKEEKGKKVPFIIVPREAAEDGTAYVFSNEEKLEKWLKHTNQFELYEEHKKWVERLKKKGPDEDPKRIKETQKIEIENATEKYLNFLKEHKLKPEDTKKKREILEDYDPFFKFEGHSLYLFDGINFEPPVAVFPGGHRYCGVRYPRFYPDLGSFENKASSLIFDCLSKAYLYTEPYYKLDANNKWVIGDDGKPMLNLDWPGAWELFLINIPNLDFAKHGFGNSVSSALVY